MRSCITDGKQTAQGSDGFPAPTGKTAAVAPGVSLTFSAPTAAGAAPWCPMTLVGAVLGACSASVAAALPTALELALASGRAGCDRKPEYVSPGVVAAEEAAGAAPGTVSVAPLAGCCSAAGGAEGEEEEGGKAGCTQACDGVRGAPCRRVPSGSMPHTSRSVRQYCAYEACQCEVEGAFTPA